MPDLSPVCLELIRTKSAAFARGVMHRGLPVEYEEVENEAWLHCLTAAHRWDPANPGASGFFDLTIRNGVNAALTRLLHPTSLKSAARLGREREMAVCIPLDQVSDRPNGVANKALAAELAAEPALQFLQDFDAGMERRELQEQLAVARVRWRAAVERVGRRFAGYGRNVGELLIGLEEAPLSKREIAKRLGLDPAEVERCARRYKRALDAAGIGALRLQVDVLEARLA